ncbi:DMT family transporter [Rhodococcus marinonascens]|uniref:DMT family transporter n=1 Tax=Rhodococcus marinonascens TaxID=38311 RepID=UPI000934100B|nr:DMT family transporter [Rhodococcus marinonascens]
MRAGLAAQYTGTALAWGASFLFIKIGLEGLSFSQVVLWRLVFGALTLGVVLGLTRSRLPSDATTWAHLSVLAVVQCLVPWLLFSWAEQTISSGLASIYNATTPLMTMSLALAFLPGEKLTDAKLFGLLLGFSGVVVVLAPWQAGIVGSVPAQLACLGATASYGVALVYLRRFILPRGIGTPAIAFMQVSIAAMALLVVTPWAASSPMHLTPAIVASMIGLGVFGTGLAFVWNTNVVRGWGPTAASTVTYLTPLVGVVLGAIVLGEGISWNHPVGALAVVSGIIVTQRSSRRSTNVMVADVR